MKKIPFYEIKKSNGQVTAGKRERKERQGGGGGTGEDLGGGGGGGAWRVGRGRWR